MAPAAADEESQPSLCLPKNRRLLNSGQFGPVFSDCRFRASGQHFLILAKPNQLAWPRLGLVIAKKHIRLSVQRNRIKRLIRESFRKQQHQLPSVDAIVLARKGLDQLDNPRILGQLNQLWQRLSTKAERARNDNNGV